MKHFLTFFLSLLIWAPALFAKQTRPNIILIMADDMGYCDIGCYGSEIETPVLDGLAANGLRFTQFYNTARCCPTRASLLTGLYPHQAGVGHMMGDRGFDGYRGNLNKQCMTIAEVLKGAGYGTYMSGKWHVSKEISPDGPKDNWPKQRGFDHFFGTIHGAGSFYDPNTLTRENTFITPKNDPEYRPPDGEPFYYTNAINDNAVKYIQEHEKKRDDDPFFIYVAHTAAHWPMHALERDVAKYKGKYDAGYKAIRMARLEKMKKLGLVDPKWKLSPQAGDWGKVKEEEKAWEIRNMEVYAAMVDCMDQGIGRIVEQLKKSGELENTLILFLQDNGGCAEGLGRSTGKNAKYKTRPEKAAFPPMKDDELQTGMIPKQTRDGFPTIQGTGAMPGPDGTYIAYGRAWANVSNTPFREYKHWVHEGGISTPLIAHWPAGISRKGDLEAQPGHLVDLMATCVDLAKAKYPAEYRGKKIKPMEGRSLKPAFAGQKIEREAIYWEHEGNRAVRVGDWKLVAKGANGKWELYNIKDDRTEQNDLASAQPERAKRLAGMWQVYAERANVLPLNPNRKQKNPKAEPTKNPKDQPAKKRNALTAIDDVEGLPRVLLIGDSISIGYTLAVRDLLKGKANVHRPQTNCGPTTKGLAEIDKWLGEGKWDVIHFNWGLHDLKYIGSTGGKLSAVDAPGSRKQVSMTDYEENVKQLVARLKKTGATLIWRSTTPVPEGAKGRVVGDSAKYNEVAAKVMKEAGNIAIDDMYTYAKKNAAKIQRKADVHYTPQGSQFLARKVVKSITEELKLRGEGDKN